jgi:CBS domain-containing protein
MVHVNPNLWLDMLHHEIESARSIDSLREIGLGMHDAVRKALGSGLDTKDIVQLISRFNGAITQRMIAILEFQEGIKLPEEAAFLALGSEGRGEQTLRTDQDSAIVYADNITQEKLHAMERFSIRFVEALETIGVPRCPGNIMVSNPLWRHSLTEWKQLLNQWITAPTQEHMLNFGIFQDLRPLHGNQQLGIQLRDHILTTVHNTIFFFPNMACHAARFPSPLTLFGRIRVERSGQHKGALDIKKAGIFVITVGSSLLALEIGYMGGNTWEKLELLGKRRLITPRDLESIKKAFSFLVKLRIQQQLLQLQELPPGVIPSNYVKPLTLSDIERDQLRQALKGVNTFLKIFRSYFKLDYISN